MVCVKNVWFNLFSQKIISFVIEDSLVTICMASFLKSLLSSKKQRDLLSSLHFQLLIDPNLTVVDASF